MANRELSIGENEAHLSKLLQRIAGYESVGLSREESSRLAQLERLRDLGQTLVKEEKIDYENISARLEELKK